MANDCNIYRIFSCSYTRPVLSIPPSFTPQLLLKNTILNHIRSADQHSLFFFFLVLLVRRPNSFISFSPPRFQLRYFISLIRVANFNRRVHGKTDQASMGSTYCSHGWYMYFSLCSKNKLIFQISFGLHSGDSSFQNRFLICLLRNSIC